MDRRSWSQTNLGEGDAAVGMKDCAAVKAAILIFEGVDDLDAFGPFEVLVNAGRGGADIEVQLLTAQPAEEIRTSHGATIKPHGVLEEDLDLLIVPGGGWNDRAEHGAWAEANGTLLPNAIRRYQQAGGALASVCTGAGILAAAGVLEGRRATTHRAARRDLEKRGVEIVDARVVDDGDVITAAGVTAGIDLALWLVERHWGQRLADAIARQMEYERRGPVATAGEVPPT
jgi:transcriptional regulator GlxA family with amidase domain